MSKEFVEIDPNAPIVPYKHKNLNVNLNLKAMCNLRCDYCSIPDISKSTNVQDATLLKNIDILLAKMVAEGYSWDFVMLIGAEPLMAKASTLGIVFNKIKEIFPKCRLKIQSNGTLLTDTYAQLLEDTMDHPDELMFGWSLDGVRDLHNEWRDNSYDLAVKNLFHANKKFAFSHQLIMSVGPQHFEGDYEEELRDFTYKCIEVGIHPTFSVVDYRINEKAAAKTATEINVATESVWRPLSKFLISNNIISLCEKYFGPGYCRREGNECSRVLFDLADGGVYQCEKTFDIHAATIDNFLYNTIEDCMVSRRGCTQNCKIADECRTCEYWDWCQGSCSLKRDDDGLSHSCSLIKEVLGYIKYELNEDYFKYLQQAHFDGREYVKAKRIEMKKEQA